MRTIIVIAFAPKHYGSEFYRAFIKVIGKNRSCARYIFRSGKYEITANYKSESIAAEKIHALRTLAKTHHKALSIKNIDDDD